MSRFTLHTEDLPLAGIAHQDRERLTFGVEFEFAIAVLKNGVKDPSPKDGRTLVNFGEHRQEFVLSMSRRR